MGDVSKPRDLEDRTFLFAESVRGFVKQLRTLSGSTGCRRVVFGSLAESSLNVWDPKFFATLFCRRQAADDSGLAACALQNLGIGIWNFLMERN